MKARTKGSLCLAIATRVASALDYGSIKNLGSSGGTGSKGGIGDGIPVTVPQAFITDAQISYTPNSTRQLSEGVAPVLVSRNVTGTSSSCAPVHSVVIDNSMSGARQSMVGFGHSWTDSAVDVFQSLEPDLLDQVMEDLFGITGNNMGFMRHTIGSSDLSGVAYTYDDNGPSFNLGEPDPTLAHFDLGPYGSAMAEMIALMGEYKSDVFLFGAPWSYPGWMKSNDLFIAPNVIYDFNQFPLLNNSFNIDLIPHIVDYFTKYIDVFKNDFGVEINGLSLQNEPLNPQGGYPTMYLDAADEANIIAAGGLGEALHERNAIFMAYDHNTDQPVYPFRVHQTAKELVDAVAWHCYASVANYTVLEDFIRSFPGTLQFMTECTNFKPSGINFQVALSFMPPVMHGASGAAMWVMATNPDFGPHSPYGGCAGCLGSIIVNSSTLYTKTNDYFMVGQFSRFVRRGAVVYDVPVGNAGSILVPNQFWVLPFKNPDDSWAVVFMNNLTEDVTVQMDFTQNSGAYWEGVIPLHTVVTWLIPSDATLANYSTPDASSLATPPYPLANSTVALNPTASGYSTGTAATCNNTATPITTISSPSTTVIPVPNTDHVIDTTGTPLPMNTAPTNPITAPAPGQSSYDPYPFPPGQPPYPPHRGQGGQPWHADGPPDHAAGRPNNYPPWEGDGGFP
ncbi:glycoside hydrolase family 30 protein [Teratosphaeria destructans]|uniref:Glycoside hydrolase family 30 protein n=1 Tax=Teratosphaeria destructans TaxID=418781 RepID=A0A9W7SQX8_9PEZI|nr:glycoside hydrolase family 30 protein [Teratosphaeria destructans]